MKLPPNNPGKHVLPALIQGDIPWKLLTTLFISCAILAAPGHSAEPWDYDRTVQMIVEEWRYAARDGVETTPPDLNWSNLALVELPWQVERTRPFAWFMSRVSLPSSWTNQDVLLHIEGTGPFSVFANGEAIARIDGKRVNTIKALLPPTALSDNSIVLHIGLAQSGVPSELNRIWLQSEPVGLSQALSEANTILNKLTDYSDAINPWKRKIQPPDEAAFKTDFDDSDWDTVKVGDEWKGDYVVALYRTRLTVPTSIRGINTAEHGTFLALDFDDPGECYINGQKVQPIKKDFRGSIFPIPEGVNPGDEILVACWIKNRWGGGKLRQATWRLPEVDKGLIRKQELQELLNRLATTMRAHDRAQASWTDSLRALIAPLKGAMSDLPTLSRKVAEAQKHLDTLIAAVDTDPVLLTPPYLQDVRSDEITVCFETSAPIPAGVEYGVDRFDLATFEEKSHETIHKITLAGLKPDTTYTYRVVAGRQTTRSYQFTTAPNAARSINFLVWGDNQSGYRMSERIARAMGATQADFVMSVGDVVDRGINWDEWTYQYLIPARHFLSSKPSYIAMGNHEYGGYDGNPDVLAWEHYFKHPMTSPGSNKYWYSFDYGNAHFVILEPLKMKWMPHENTALGNTVVPEDPQLRWLENDLKANQGKHDWTFVFFHEPAFAETWSGGYYDGEDFIRNAIIPILEKYRVDMVFNGHTHAYERGFPHPKTKAGNHITYIITGGGGGGLDKHKYKEWDKIDLPDHPAVADSDAPDEGMYYRHHYCDVTVDGKTLTFKAQEVLANGRLGDVMDHFKLKKE